MSFRIFRNDDAFCIFVENATGPQFFESIQATINEDSDAVSIRDLVRDRDIITNLPHTEFLKADESQWGTDAQTACDNMNAAFAVSGTATNQVPDITSATTIELTEGESLNYELTADRGVGFEFDGLPTGVTTVEGNARKLIGGTQLTTAGSPYTFTARAINYNGQNEETITLNVSTPPFANTRSTRFQHYDFLRGTASSAHPMERTGSSGDPWSVGLWVKLGTAVSGTQDFMFYGTARDLSNQPYVRVRATGNPSQVQVHWGSNNNYVQVSTPTGALTFGTWHHVLVTYDGGTTGASSGSINTYYGRFAVYVDGVLQTLTGTHGNYGDTRALSGTDFIMGFYGSGRGMRGGTAVDEVAIWSTDETANAATIYNSGTPFDLTTLASSPTHYYHMGDGDTFPTISDNAGSNNFTMNNMTSSDFINDVPS